MEDQRVRISDIAQELGLSTATVSNVIHGKTKKISEETQKRVMALLEEKQYIPSMAGILLARNSSRIIGVFVNDHEKYEGHTLDDFFISSSLNYLSTEIEANGQFMMVKKAKSAEEIIQFASMWNLDGIVVIGFCDQDYVYLRNHMRIPFVVYDGYCKNPERIVNITTDNYDGGHQAGCYLRENGHERALCIADNDICVDMERVQGFQTGFAPGFADYLLVPMHRQQRWQFYREHLNRILNTTAVFAVSDYYAVDFIGFLNEQGIRVPEDISLISIDDSELAELAETRLTSVHHPTDRLGARAAENLLAAMKNNAFDGTCEFVTELVERDSVRRLKRQ